LSLKTLIIEIKNQKPDKNPCTINFSDLGINDT
jgi:hypothetical protein